MHEGHDEYLYILEGQLTLHTRDGRHPSAPDICWLRPAVPRTASATQGRSSHAPCASTPRPATNITSVMFMLP
ncbi:hypothetical protein [Streptomyces sp. NPDC048277]|uniref:hypothetical protein n=1 Tax=Streptomyces sp. NPDC048277 TaxID=3155027 RepID=UPI0033CF1A2D